MGNWRDSTWAYKQIDPIIAPFDVNAVFYPRALEIIKEYKAVLGINEKQLAKACRGWHNKREAYSYTAQKGKVRYALALYGEKFKQMEVSHLDESYLYYFFDATEAEITSFAERLLDKDYFYTIAGPTLIAHRNKFGYTNQEYHGLVIWTKQAAFVVGGLARQYAYGKKQKWSTESLELIQKALITTSKTVMRAYEELGHAFPELHYTSEDTVKYFATEGLSNSGASKVQLWSAVGARRIMREYYNFL